MSEQQPELTSLEREFIVRSIISSQALSDITVDRELVERVLDEVLQEPLVELAP